MRDVEAEELGWTACVTTELQVFARAAAAVVDAAVPAVVPVANSGGDQAVAASVDVAVVAASADVAGVAAAAANWVVHGMVSAAPPATFVPPAAQQPMRVPTKSYSAGEGFQLPHLHLLKKIAI